MISIITCIYNQLAMNKMFFESLVKNTKNEFELIVVDNNSSDGSREFFEKQKDVIVIRNNGNYNYPYCQNRGIEIAKYDILCFFNNDLIITENWDEKIIEFFDRDDRIKVLSVATIDHIEKNSQYQKVLYRKWKRIKYPIQFLFGSGKFSLKLMLFMMYGDLNKYAKNRFKTWGYKTVEGYSGSVFIMKRKFLDIIGTWDERIQGSDFDLFNRTKECANDYILPVQIALGVYFHHFQRLTLRNPHPTFENKKSMITVDQKWGDKTTVLRKDISS